MDRGDSCPKGAEFNHYSYPVVTDDEKLLGVVYKSNLDEAARRTPSALVPDVMQTHFETMREDALAVDAFEEMNSRQITRFLVVDDQGRVRGILTRLDLLKAMERATRGPPSG